MRSPENETPPSALGDQKGCVGRVQHNPVLSGVLLGCLSAWLGSQLAGILTLLLMLALFVSGAYGRGSSPWDYMWLLVLPLSFGIGYTLFEIFVAGREKKGLPAVSGDGVAVGVVTYIILCILALLWLLPRIRGY